MKRKSLLVDGSGRHFSYEAADDAKKRRKPVTTKLQSEDAELTAEKRAKLVTATRDLPRNFTIAAWMIRKHLDYVANHTFQSRSGNDALDDVIDAFMEDWQLPENCDAAGRHPLGKMVRIGEARAVLDGDVFFGKLSSGRIQAVEGDRVRNPMNGALPENVNPEDMVHGVCVSPTGRAKGFAVHKRGRWANNYTFERIVPVMFMRQHGYFDRFDQVRGISPIVPAINTLRDVYEGFDHALARMKISQLFALAMYRSEYDQHPGAGEDGDGQAEVDFGKGPIVLDMEGQDKVEFLESKQPSTELQQFSSLMIGVALKALDIPLSFYDEAYTNWSGQRQGLLLYMESARIKRQAIRMLLDDLTYWRLSLAVLNGEIALPSTLTVDDLNWEWMPTGMPWLDPLKEVTADMAAVKGGVDCRQDICRRKGTNFFDIADKLAEETKYLADRGLPTDPELPIVPPDQPAPEKPKGK